jgi:hypothetical protein
MEVEMSRVERKRELWLELELHVASDIELHVAKLVALSSCPSRQD